MSPRLLVALALLLGACGAEPSGPPTLLSGAESEALVDAHLGARGDAPAPTAEPAPAVERLTLGARILDERYQPLAGARLAWLERAADGSELERAFALAERNGTVWLALERAQLPAEGGLQLALSAPGRATQRLELARARWGESVCLLGEFTLAPASTK
ncbi:MAG: hypothetical protein EXS08_02390 [Planctomycetes bacterium]|nr:hypothetical protein [Planctomycetota bacterium]